jgi:anthranilate synthase component 2
MILLLDNYDSFTYNLVQYLGELGAEVEVLRNDARPAESFAPEAYRGLVISPGPGMPADAGISIGLIRAFAGRRPILGVCLGHQAIAECFGGAIARAPAPVHGQFSAITHDGRGIFAGLPPELRVGRYHSLVAERDLLPESLAVSASTCDGIVMGLRHRTLPIEGVQFHPESILTEHGHAMLANFLRACSS